MQFPCHTGILHILKYIINKYSNSDKLAIAFKATPEDVLNKAINSNLEWVNNNLESCLNRNTHLLTEVDVGALKKMIELKEKLCLTEKTVEIIQKLVDKTDELDKKTENAPPVLWK